MSQALVMGGGFCGLVSARVLSDHFQKVTVVERDSLPLSAEARKGVPQSHQLHLLMILGQRILERLFSGIDERLASFSCPLRDQIRDLEIFVGNGLGFAPRFPSGLSVRSFSRPLLEAVVRERVKALPNVEFLEGETVTDMKTGPRGVEAIVLNSSRELSADLFIGALGRGSVMARWLERATGQKIETTVVNSNLGYATRTYRLPADKVASFESDLLVLARYPDNPRLGTLRRVEGNLIQATLAGYLGVHPPSDSEGFENFAGLLEHPRFYETLRTLEPVSPVHPFRNTANFVHHYEKLDRWPDNLVMMGDSFCSLNPTYGQGMTVALMACELLDARLKAKKRLGKKFQKILAKSARPFFDISRQLDEKWTALDRGGPSRLQRLLLRLKEDMIALSYRNPADYVRFTEARNHLRPPLRLLTPALVAKTVFRTASKLVRP